MHIDQSEAEFALRRLLTAEAGAVASKHAWLSETDRWKELVFALLTRVPKQLPEIATRRATEKLSTLGLLDVRHLFSNAANAGAVGEVHARRFTEVLKEVGFAEDEARRALDVVREAARGLNENFQGKVQLYLRKYGEMMLADVPKFFDFKSLDKRQVAFAFKYWLQNVLAMPVSLVDSTMRRFCDENKLTAEQLISSADNLNVNVALLDDLIHFRYGDEAASA